MGNEYLELKKQYRKEHLKYMRKVFLIFETVVFLCLCFTCFIDKQLPQIIFFSTLYISLHIEYFCMCYKIKNNLDK